MMFILAHIWILFYLGNPKRLVAFAEVFSAISFSGTLWISASFSATNRVRPGSLGLPRWGTGLRYGESVSTKILSKGKSFATSGK